MGPVYKHAAAGEREVAADELRYAMSHFATGVAIVTARGENWEPAGTTVNAITSLSLEPPLVLVCFDLASATLRAVRSHGAFVINVLGTAQGHLARGFAQRGGVRPWSTTSHRPGFTGTPRLDGVLMALECRVEHHLQGGDHEIVVGRVLDVETAPHRSQPLLFYRGAYRTVAEP
jgi:flavin reductase (DIM6/NTAB) family NADH-FMN oxidoreductase RutF